MRSSLAGWGRLRGGAARASQARLFEILKTSPKLFAGETRAPVLDPGRKKVKPRQLWAYAGDDRPCGGNDRSGDALVLPGSMAATDDGPGSRRRYPYAAMG